MEKIKRFANCIPVKGFSKSIVCDLQNNSFESIPNSLTEILVKHDGKSIDEIKNIYKNEYNEIIDEYIDFLEEKDFIFYTYIPNYFPEIELSWDTPSQITNCIIGESSLIHDYDSIFKQLEILNCKALQLRFFCKKNVDEIQTILNLVKLSRLQDIEIIMLYNKDIKDKDYENLFMNNQRMSIFYIYSSIFEKTVFADKQKQHPIIYSTEKINDNSFCGNIHPNNFSVNLKYFTESQKHNTCLNRKISIDVNGEIKNCPSMPKSYGSIKDTTLKEAMEKPGFKDLWFIHKDKIEVCKDCEFRHICTDCRAYIKDPKNIYSQPAKCKYNPYIALWEGQENYVNVESMNKPKK